MKVHFSTCPKRFWGRDLLHYPSRQSIHKRFTDMSWKLQAADCRQSKILYKQLETHIIIDICSDSGHYQKHFESVKDSNAELSPQIFTVLGVHTDLRQQSLSI